MDAIGCFDLSGYSAERLALLQPKPRIIAETATSRVLQLFGDEASPFFQALRVEVTARWTMPQSFAVLIVEFGSGVLQTKQGETPIASGDTWVVPFADLPIAIAGGLRCLVCMPPQQ